MKRVRRNIVDVLTALCILVYAIAASLVSVHRFWQYEVFYYDFGIFDAAIWNVSRFRAPVIDHFVVGGKWIFADHFSPGIFLLSPLYWVTSRPEILLIAQAVAVGVSGGILYALGRRILKNRFAAAGIAAAYLLFIGTQNALIADIHEVTFMMLPLSLTFYALAARKMKLYWLSLLVTLSFKESSALLGIGLAVFLYVSDRKLWRAAAVTGVLSLLWGYLTTQVIIPAFYGNRYFYTPVFDSNPLRVLSMFFDTPDKRRTIISSLESFGFLPLFAPAMWPLIIQDLAARFLQHEFQLRYTLGLHYSAQMAVILAVSSVYGLATLSRRFRFRYFLPVTGILLLAISAYLHQFRFHGPLGLSYNPAFYRHTNDFAFLDRFVSHIPRGSTVMTQNNIAPHLIHTHNVYLMRSTYSDYLPEYIALDLRDGQNPNNFFGSDIVAVNMTLPNDPKYEEYYREGDMVIYKRKAGR